MRTTNLALVAPPEYSPTPSEPFTAASRPGAAGGRASGSGAASGAASSAASSASAGAVEPGIPEDVRLAAGGDRRAFERLYSAHVDRIHTLCVRMCADRAMAEELTQDVFVRAWDKLGLFRGESAFGTWLHRMAVNVVLNHRKVAGRERSRSAADDAVEVVASRPLQLGDRMDLEQAVAQLPPGARRVFLLHDVEGYKHEEIAEMLGVTSGGTKAQLHRARMLLREALQR
jgi:RNA polymerase sigma-70 factor (ECF subfamily)